MTKLTLTIGDKNLSSWSLRPWILMTHAGIPFEEQTIRLDQPTSKNELTEKSPSGLVPFLRDGDVEVWDSLAIAEYLNDKHPEKQLWPEDAHARAHARAMSAEMHSGFSALRTVWPMCFTRKNLEHLTSGGVKRDIDRIVQLWTDALEKFGAGSGSGGPFLFGEFSIADAMYAPVVSRFVTYGPLDLSGASGEYVKMIWSLPAMKAWGEGARKELSQS